MEQTVQNGKKARTAPVPKAVAVRTQPVARIVKMRPRESSKVQKMLAKKLGGTYRIIHSQMCVPRPHEDWHMPDGSINPHELPFVYALPGDEVAFGDLEAATLLELNLIEPLDAKPSMVGKGWKPPTTTRRVDMGGPPEDEDESTYAHRQMSKELDLT